MTGITHRLGGIAAGTAMTAVLHTDLTESAALIAIATLGSLIPDIDNRCSTISRKWRLTSVLVTAGQTVVRGIATLLPKRAGKRVREMIGHRGITHSLAAILLFPVIFYMAALGLQVPRPLIYAAAVAGGVATHLFFDMLAGGVPLFLPLTAKRVMLARIKTGGLAEGCFRLLLLIVFFYTGMEIVI